MKIFTINLTNHGIGQKVWTLLWKEILVEEDDGAEHYITSVMPIQVELRGVWFGIEDGEEVNLFDVFSPEVNDGEVLRTRTILYTEGAGKEKFAEVAI
jgi:hypothetical protein